MGTVQTNIILEEYYHNVVSSARNICSLDAIGLRTNSRWFLYCKKNLKQEMGYKKRNNLLKKK